MLRITTYVVDTGDFPSPSSSSLIPAATGQRRAPTARQQQPRAPQPRVGHSAALTQPRLPTPALSYTAPFAVAHGPGPRVVPTVLSTRTVPEPALQRPSQQLHQPHQLTPPVPLPSSPPAPSVIGSVASAASAKSLASQPLSLVSRAASSSSSTAPTTATTRSSASTVPRPLLPLVPRPLKLLLFLLLLANYRSFPGYWTVRVNVPNLTLHARRHAFLLYVRCSLLLLRAARGLHQQAVVLSNTKLATKLSLPKIAPVDTDGPQVLKLGLPGARWGWMQSLAGANFALSPLDSRSLRVVYRTWVGFDDCELGRRGLRMSKSAYARNVDYALADFVAKRLAPFVADGGSADLVKSSFDFTSGTSALAFWQRYAVWVTIESWDDTTLNVTARFVTRKTAEDKERDVFKLVVSSPTASFRSSLEKVEEAVAEAADAAAQPAKIEFEDGTQSEPDMPQEMSSSFTTAADFTEVAIPDTPSVTGREIESASDSDVSDPDVEKTVTALDDSKAPAPPLEEQKKPAVSTRKSEENLVWLDTSAAGSSSPRSVKVDSGSTDATSLLLGDDDADYTTHVIATASYTFSFPSASADRCIPPTLVLAACGYGHFDAVREAAAGISSLGRAPATTTWDRLQRLRYAGAPDDLGKFWRGGWANGGAGRFWKRDALAWEKA